MIKQTSIAGDHVHQLKFVGQESFVVLDKSATQKLESEEGLLVMQQ